MKAPVKATPIHDAMVAWLHKAVVPEAGIRAGLIPLLLGDRIPPPEQYWWTRGNGPRDVIELLKRLREEQVEKVARYKERYSQKPSSYEAQYYQDAIDKLHQIDEVRRQNGELIHNLVVPDIDLSCHVKWEVPIATRGRGIAGYVDLMATVRWIKWYLQADSLAAYDPKNLALKWNAQRESQNVYFEVKPEIPSVGELLRQVNKYRHYLDDEGIWVVVSPDDRWTQVLNNQGIQLFKPDLPGQQKLALESIEPGN